LKQLSERNRETLLMYYFLEMNNEEIAKKQNISIRSVYEDIKVATERLSALILGVDGLNVH